MKETTRLKLPYPEDADPPNGPAQIKSLAEAVEAQLARAGAQAKKKAIAGEESRTNVAYGLLTTADRVEGMEVHAGDLLIVQYEALWKEAQAGKGRAAIFLNETQLKVPKANIAPVTQAAWTGGGFPGAFVSLLTAPVGLVSTTASTEGSNASLVETGLASVADGSSFMEIDGSTRTGAPAFTGGLCVIRNLAAATYSVSVRFKASEGSVSAKNRLLRAWTIEPT